jgi:quinolinate synthase
MQLGRYIEKQTGRSMVLWPGACSVHVTFSERMLVRLKVEHPSALVLAHPECQDGILRLADHIGSTTSILTYATTSPARTFIIATESGILHQMKKACPEKIFIPAPPENGCACNECPYMRLNTLERVYVCMRDRQPSISLAEDLRVKALRPLERMLAMSA